MSYDREDDDENMDTEDMGFLYNQKDISFNFFIIFYNNN